MKINRSILLLLVVCTIISISNVSCKKNRKNKRKGKVVSARAPAGYSSGSSGWSREDCLCQCSTASFKDKWGKTHGNCQR